MSKFHINTKSATYMRDKENFIKDLKQFYETKGAPPFRVPILNGKEIDLYLFHLIVFQRGGWTKITNHGASEHLIRALQLPANCLNIEALLKCIYSRYLERYERSKNPQGRDEEFSADLEDDYRRSRGPPRVVQTYTSTENHSSRNLPRVAGPSERLALSLLSPLPNEQDFALNVCTVLAADSANRLPLASTPHMLDFLLAHAGVYNHPTLRDIVGRCYRETRGLSPDDFWCIRGGGGGAAELCAEERWLPASPELAVQALAAQITLAAALAGDRAPKRTRPTDTELSDEWWLPAPPDKETLFTSTIEGGARDVIAQRVLQIATIARNISFHEENVPFLGKHQTFLRFLLLSVNSWMGGLKQSGMDTLGNVAQEILVKDPSTCLLTRHLFSSIMAALQSEDRARILNGLEILNKLAQNDQNEDILLKCLEQKMYHQVCAFLTIHDIMLLVVTLECVYALTSLGERACEYVVKVKGLVDTLVSLITVEAQSYGPKACILMRVVETVAGAGGTAGAPGAQGGPPAPDTPPKARLPASPAPLHTYERHHAQPQQQQPQQQQHQLTTVQPALKSQEELTPVVSSPPSLFSTPSTQATVRQTVPETKPTAFSVQQQHAHQQAIQENEQFALMWLRNCWEPCSAATPSTIEAAELYRQYLACCSKVGRKGVIAPLHFPRCVRSVFGGMTGPNAVKTSTGDMQQHYIGIKIRPNAASMQSKTTTPTPTVKQSGPSSPILKAQLSKLEQSKQQQAANNPHPHLSQALTEAPPPAPTGSGQVSSSQASVAASSSSPAAAAQPPAANNTSLIKHLLAHKVEPILARNTQVAQRQNQQRMLGQQGTQPVQPQRISPTNLEDPEALISCSTITSTGVTSTSPLLPTQSMKVPPVITQTSTVSNQLEEALDSTKKELEEAPHNSNMQQNKMLADLLEKKSSPPMPNNPGQLPVIINSFSLKDENNLEEKEASVAIKQESDEPPAKKMKKEESVSTTAANLYAALAASALEDEEDLAQQQAQTAQQNREANSNRQPQQISVRPPQPTTIIQQTNVQMAQPTFQQTSLIQHTQQLQPPVSAIQTVQTQKAAAQAIVQSSVPPGLQQSSVMKQNVQLQQTAIQLQQGNLLQQQNMQLQQPMQVLQVQQSAMQMQVQQIQQALQVQQQPIQVQIQQPTMQMSVQPTNVQVQQMDMQLQQIGGPTGQIILQEKQVMQNPQFLSQQPVQIIATPNTTQTNFGYIPGGSVPHKTIIILQGSAHNSPITLTVNNSAGLDENTLNSIISQASDAISQQHALNPSSVIQTQQRIIQNQPTVIQTQPIVTSQAMMQPQNIIQTTGVIKQQIIQGQNQVSCGQKAIISQQPQAQKPQQIVMTQAMPALVSTGQTLTQTSGQVVMAGQTIVTQSQQVITVDGKQIMVNRQIASQPTQPVQVRPNQPNQTANQTMLQNQINQNIQQNILPPGRPVLNKQQTVIGIQKMPAEKVNPPVSTGVVVMKNEQPAETSQTKSDVIQVNPNLDNPWVCQWRHCNRMFDTAGAVFAHAARVHCPPATPPTECPCLWFGCDKLPRKRFGLMTHLQDKHCTAEALRTAHAARRRASSQQSGSQQTSQSATSNEETDSPTSSGYAPNAALHALNRHAVDFLNPRELMDDNEGPVTKSIRLTAALILRNIVIYSNNGRRHLKSYEPHLASIALSSVEASRTVAQILYDMNNI